MVSNSLKTGEYIRVKGGFQFVNKQGQVISTHQTVAVMIDFKHKIVLAHGDTVAVEECYKRIQKGCIALKALDEFQRYMLLLEKRDWETSVLNEMAKDRKSIPSCLRRKYGPKKAMKKQKRIPVLEITSEIRAMLVELRGLSSDL